MNEVNASVHQINLRLIGIDKTQKS